MKKYEIHITGEEGINDILEILGVKNIIVELLTPDYELLRTEYMSSYVREYNEYETCLLSVLDLVDQIKYRGGKVIRVKIESPYYEEFTRQSIYMESHFNPENNIYPISRNRKSQKLMGTDREYDKTKYIEFKDRYEGKEVEMCLYDTFVEEDSDWMNLYKK